MAIMYLANIILLCSSYFIGLKTALTMISHLAFYLNPTTENFNKLLLATSIYLFGVWNTLFYCVIYNIHQIISITVQYFQICIDYCKQNLNGQGFHHTKPEHRLRI